MNILFIISILIIFWLTPNSFLNYFIFFLSLINILFCINKFNTRELKFNLNYSLLFFILPFLILLFISKSNYQQIITQLLLFFISFSFIMLASVNNFKVDYIFSKSFNLITITFLLFGVFLVIYYRKAYFSLESSNWVMLDFGHRFAFDLIRKQSVGTVSIISIAMLIFYYDFKKITKIFIILFIILNIIIGNRSATVTLILIPLIILVLNSDIFGPKIKAVILSLFFTFSLVALYFFSSFLNYLNWDVRIYSLMNTLYIIQNYFFGIGFGNYQFFDNFSFLNLDFFKTIEIKEKVIKIGYIPTALESDLLRVYASFGIFGGLIFYYLIFNILFQFRKIIKTRIDYTICIIYFCYLIQGIFQDVFLFNSHFYILLGYILGKIINNRYECLKI